MHVWLTFDTPKFHFCFWSLTNSNKTMCGTLIHTQMHNHNQLILCFYCWKNKEKKTHVIYVRVQCANLCLIHPNDEISCFLNCFKMRKKWSIFRLFFYFYFFSTIEFATYISKCWRIDFQHALIYRSTFCAYFPFLAYFVQQLFSSIDYFFPKQKTTHTYEEWTIVFLGRIVFLLLSWVFFSCFCNQYTVKRMPK